MSPLISTGKPACVCRFFSCHFCSDGRPPCTHAGRRIRGVCASLYGSKLHMTTWFNVWLSVFWVFPAAVSGNWSNTVTLHCLKSLSKKNLSAADSYFLLKGWRVEQWQRDLYHSYPFITTSGKASKKTIITGLAVKGSIFCLSLLMFIHGKVSVYHNKC